MAAGYNGPLGKAYASRSCICAGACWRARCHRCGQVVSKHDFDASGAWAALKQHDQQTHAAPGSLEGSSTRHHAGEEGEH